jgi:valyl-tRNA synthetase
MGHVLSYSYFDFVARYKRMNGFNVYYPQGWDCQGFPTEVKVEAKYGKQPPAVFRNLCISWTEEFIAKMRSQMKSLGFSADWRYEYKTMDPNYHKKVQISLLEMYKKGLIYRAKHPVYWCPSCSSALAKTDTEDIVRETNLYYINFEIDGKPIPIATTRPELMHACVAVAFNPKDSRYNNLKQTKIKTALGKIVPLIADEDVDMEFGSGLVMICTFGDKQDIIWTYKHKLEVIEAIDEHGRAINTSIPEVEGLKLDKVKEKLIEKFKAEGKLIKTTQITQSVKIHDRCKKPIEYILSMQWFAKITDKADEIIDFAKQIRWVPDFGIHYLIDWAKYVEWDWVISRQRIFGTPIPFWIDPKTGQVYPAEESELPFNPDKKPTKIGPEGQTLYAETSTCDCWVDSSITPLIISRWLDDPEFFKRVYPVSLRPQGVEIVRTWAFYTIYRCSALTGKAPFKEILLNGNVLAPDGKKMSKSLGNIIAPDKLISEYSADAVRQWAALSGAMAKDRPFSYQDIKYAKSFITKLINAARFVEKNLTDFSEKDFNFSNLRVVDRWILRRFYTICKEVTESFEAFDFHKATKLVQDFFWHEFCDFYIEYVKHRLYQPEVYGQSSKIAAQYCLKKVLLGTCQLFAPISPHVTEEIWQAFYPGNSIHTSSWPKEEFAFDFDKEAEEKISFLNQTISYIRNYKASKKQSLNSEISCISISCNFSIDDIKEEIIATGKVKNIKYARGEPNIRIEE